VLHLEAHGLRLDGLRLGLRVAHVDVVGQPAKALPILGLGVRNRLTQLQPGAPLPAKRHDLPALG